MTPEGLLRASRFLISVFEFEPLAHRQTAALRVVAVRQLNAVSTDRLSASSTGDRVASVVAPEAPRTSAGLEAIRWSIRPDRAVLRTWPILDWLALVVPTVG